MVPTPKIKTKANLPGAPNTLSPTPVKRIMLKDTPLQAGELLFQRKSTHALNCLMLPNKLIQLYKCPAFNCVFSTDHKKQFEQHITSAHPDLIDKQIPCLYCDYKTDFKLIGVHYDVRHSRCLYCCAYCFYRGILQSYVEIHQEKVHSTNQRRVLMVPYNREASTSHAQLVIPVLKNVVPVITCGQPGTDKYNNYS